MSQTSVVVEIDSPIGTISPRLYGHFAEHLARCCYDGLWVGTDESAIPQDGGFRTDVVAALRALPVPLLRWPGGCYADHYHWRDGIGPRDQRPRRLGMSWVYRSKTTTGWARTSSYACAPSLAPNRTWPAMLGPEVRKSCVTGWSTATAPETPR